MNKTVKLYMTYYPICVKNTETYSEIVDKMKLHNLSHIPVTDQDGRLVGVISNNDILKRSKKVLTQTTGATYSNMHLSTLQADSFMTPDVVTVKPSDSIDLAIEIFLQQKFHCIPVVNQKYKVVGMLTGLDILKGYYQEHG